jgi:hypothetical protein
LILAPLAEDVAVFDEDRFFNEREWDVDDGPFLVLDGVLFFRPLFFDMMDIIYNRIFELDIIH